MEDRLEAKKRVICIVRLGSMKTAPVWAHIAGFHYNYDCTYIYSLEAKIGNDSGRRMEQNGRDEEKSPTPLASFSPRGSHGQFDTKELDHPSIRFPEGRKQKRLL